MRLPLGVSVLVVLRDGSTIQGTTARSGQWGVHRLEKCTVYSRTDAPALAGYFLIPKSRVEFVQIETES